MIFNRIHKNLRTSRNNLMQMGWLVSSAKLVLVVLCAFFYTRAWAGERTEVVALKNNLLYDAAATPNLQLEVRLTNKWTLEFGAGLNPFPLSDEKYPKWRHLSVSVAPRYWFCHAFNRGFISFNAAYAHYNVGGGAYPISWMYTQMKDSRYQGDAIMGGVSGGWHFAISPHFGIELEGGADAGYSWYDRYECKHCGVKTESGGRWLVLPKVGINLVVLFGGDKKSFVKRCDCEKLEEKEEEPQDTIVEQPVDTVAAEAPISPIESEESEVSEVSETSETSEASEIAEEPAQETPAEPEVVEEEQPQPVVEEQPQPVVEEQPRPEVVEEQSQPEVVEEPAPVVEEPVKKGEPKERICDCMLRPGEPYRKYDIKTPLSSDSRNVFIYFEVYDTKLDRAFLENNGSMDSLMNILAKVQADSTLRLERIQVVGFASFDGPLAPNERLAQQRALSIKKYIQSKYALDDEQFIICNGGESWVEMRYLMESESFEGQAEVFRIIDEEENLDKREALIKKLNNGQVYQYMKTNYRKILRNLGCITIYYEKVE